MGLAPHRLVFDSTDKDGLVVRAALPVELHLKVQQDKATTVYADEIIVRGAVSTGGHNLSLFCRVLRFESDARIDADGAPGQPDFAAGLRPEGAREPGARGEHGADGGHGHPGGRIVIRSGSLLGKAVLQASGGRGGRAQDGGHGQPGAGGAAGADAKVRYGGMPPSANGHGGGPGGPAGLPGRRAGGGPGGAIEMATIEAVAAGSVDAQAPAGPPAPEAQPGTPGAGGPGGPGGKVVFQKCEFVGRDRTSLRPLAAAEAAELDKVGHAAPPTAFRAALYENLLTRAASPVPLAMSCWDDSTSYGTTGPGGAGGDPRTAEAAARQALVPVADGTVSLTTVGAAEFAQGCDPIFLDLLVAELEDEYRKAGISPSGALRDKIEFWMTALAGQQEHTEALARLYSMARKAALGLDVYGYSLERAPLLNFDTYQSLVKDGALASARLIERAYTDYWQVASQQDAALVQLQRALDAASDARDTLRQQHARVGDNAAALLASLPALDASVMAAYTVLMDRRQQLDAAIQASQPGCDLIGSLTAVATIVAGVASGGAGFISAAAAGKRLYDTFSADGATVGTLWDDRKVIEDDLKEVAKGAGSVGEAITKIRDAVNALTPAQRELPRFLVERGEFDRIAAEYTDLPQAQQYKEAGHHYLKCVETRNQAIVDYNAALAQWVELQAMLASARRIEQAAASGVGGARDLSQAAVMGIMTRLYVDALALAGQMVHAEGKALGYLFGRPADVPFSTLNVATIAAAHADITNRWREFKERFRPKRNLKPGVLAFKLRDFVTDAAWNSFLKVGTLPFTLRRDHPGYFSVLRYMSGLRITGLSIALDGATVPSDLRYLGWTVRQLGHETIYPSEQRPVRFSHTVISATAFTAFNGEPPIVEDDFSEGELYAGISPFASWIISCDDETLLRISNIADVTFGVSGYFVESGNLTMPAAALLATVARAAGAPASAAMQAPSTLVPATAGGAVTVESK